MPLAVLEYWAKLRKFTQTTTKKCHSLHFLELKEFKMVLNGNCGISFNILMIFNISFKDSVSDIRYIRFPLNYLIWCHGKTAVSETWVVYFFSSFKSEVVFKCVPLGQKNLSRQKHYPSKLGSVWEEVLKTMSFLLFARKLFT